MSDSFHLSFGAANKRKVEESHKCSSLGIPKLMVGGWYPYVSEAFRHIQTNNLNSGDLWVRRWGSNFLFWQCLKPCTCFYNWSKFKTWATLETKVLFGSWTFSSHLWHEQMNCSAMRTMQGWLVWWSCTQHNIKIIAEDQVRAELVCWPYTELNTPKNKRKPLFRANRQSHRLPSLFFGGSDCLGLVVLLTVFSKQYWKKHKTTKYVMECSLVHHPLKICFKSVVGELQSNW
jgi:hypothetical protein